MAKEALQFLHPLPLPVWENYMYWSKSDWVPHDVTILAYRTIEIISARLGTKYPLKKGFQICINEREYPLGRVTF